jgi:hypothetical protein
VTGAFVVVAVATSASGCAIATVPAQALAWAMASDADSVRRYQRYLARYPRGAEAEEARRRIEQRIWERTRHARSPAALKSYLARFPDVPQSLLARERLVTLRYEAALAAGTLAAFDDFLDHVSEGPYATRIRARRTGRLYRHAVAAAARGDRGPLAHFLLHHGDSPLALPARERLEALEYAAAHDDEAGLEAFLARWPTGWLRDRAFADLRRVTAARLAAQCPADDPAPERADCPFAATDVEEWLDRFGFDAAVFAVRARLALADARAWLSPEPLDAVADRFPATPAAARATLDAAALRALRAHDAERAVLLARLANELFFAPSADVTAELSSRLSPDVAPPVAWRAAAGLAQSGDPAAVEPLLRCLGHPFIESRVRCTAAITRLVDRLPPAERRDTLARAERTLAVRAASPDMHARLGVVRELAGDVSGARRAFRRALVEPELGAFATARLAALEARAGNTARAAALASAGLAELLAMARGRAEARAERARRTPPLDATASARLEALEAAQMRGVRRLVSRLERLAPGAPVLAELRTALASAPHDAPMPPADGPVRILARVRREAALALRTLQDPLTAPALARAAARDPDAAVRTAARVHGSEPATH